TSDTYISTPPVPLAPVGDPVSRYLLLPPPGAVRAALALTTLQKIVLAAAGALALFTLTMRLATVEAMSPRLGAFFYVVIGVLIFLMFVFIGGQTNAFGFSAMGPAL